MARKPHPLDHDGDGKPGGSLPKSERGKAPAESEVAEKAPEKAAETAPENSQTAAKQDGAAKPDSGKPAAAAKDDGKAAEAGKGAAALTEAQAEEVRAIAEDAVRRMVPPRGLRGDQRG